MVPFLYPEPQKPFRDLTANFIEGAVTVTQTPFNTDQCIILRKAPGNVIQKPPDGKIKLIRHNMTSVA
jgi:hypothetical protein